jgi:hypothetical protein
VEREKDIAACGVRFSSVQFSSIFARAVRKIRIAGFEGTHQLLTHSGIPFEGTDRLLTHSGIPFEGTDC